ncbi:hypothetical protein [Methanosphaera sp.]
MEINYIKKILNIIQKLSEWKYIEYIYLDKDILNDFEYYLSEFKNKIIITKNINDYYEMLTIQDNNTYTPTIINSVPIIDLIIINQDDDNLKKYGDIHTIYLKKLNNDLIYVNDKLTKTHIIHTKHEEIILQGSGLDIKLLNHSTHASNC